LLRIKKDNYTIKTKKLIELTIKMIEINKN